MIKKWKNNRNKLDPWFRIDNSHYPEILMIGRMESLTVTVLNYFYSNGKIVTIKYQWGTCDQAL